MSLLKLTLSPLVRGNPNVTGSILSSSGFSNETPSHTSILCFPMRCPGSSVVLDCIDS